MKLVQFFLVLLFAGPITASAEHSASLEQSLQFVETWLDAQQAYGDFPGLSAGIQHDQELIWTRAWGEADREQNKPATIDSIYSICSISKLFTAIAVMQLRDAGQLSLDDAITEYLPSYDLEQSHPDGPDVTIWGLLTHSSGLPRESDHPYWSPPDYPFPSSEEVRDHLSDQAALYPAQTYFQYSNLGLSLVGEIVAAVSGLPFDEYVRQKVLAPLGLENTRSTLPQGNEGEKLAIGYAAKDRQGERARLPIFQARGIAPAAGFSSNVPDLADFAAWPFRILAGRDQEVLRGNTLREMQRVQWMDPKWETTRGLGFGVYRFEGVTSTGHSGACPGYRSTLRLHPSDRLAVVLLSNAGEEDLPLELYASRIYQILQPALTRKQDVQMADDGAELDRFVGTYDYAPWGGEIAVIRWQAGLSMVFLPSDNPLDSLEELRQKEGPRFVRMRDDGEEGEEIRFEIDGPGPASALWQHSNPWPRLELDD